MKYILAILILTSVALADISHSFRIPIQTDASSEKTNTATWSGTRSASAGNRNLASAESLVVYSWCSDLATDTFKIGRSAMLTDTINSASYIDSINDIAAGNSVRFDSLKLFVTAFHAVTATAGCTHKIYMLHLDTCVVNSGNLGPTSSLVGLYNDWLSSPVATVFSIADSVSIDTNTFGMVTGGPTVIDFTLTDRAKLDAIECMISMGGSIAALAFNFVSCYDYSNTQPDPATSYNSKVSLYSLENAGADPYCIMYWTEVEPVTASGDGTWQGSWRNAVNSGWRNLWR